MKVFTCSAPYPVDVFVRLSLRERGWVEKFGPRMLTLATSSTETTDRQLQCNNDEGHIMSNIVTVCRYSSSCLSVADSVRLFGAPVGLLVCLKLQ